MDEGQVRPATGRAQEVRQAAIVLLALWLTVSPAYADHPPDHGQGGDRHEAKHHPEPSPPPPEPPAPPPSVPVEPPPAPPAPDEPQAEATPTDLLPPVLTPPKEPTSEPTPLPTAGPSDVVGDGPRLVPDSPRVVVDSAPSPAAGAAGDASPPGAVSTSSRAQCTPPVCVAVTAVPRPAPSAVELRPTVGEPEPIREPWWKRVTGLGGRCR